MSDDLNPFDPHSDVRPMNYAAFEKIWGGASDALMGTNTGQKATATGLSLDTVYDAIRRWMRKGESARAYRRLNQLPVVRVTGQPITQSDIDEP